VARGYLHRPALTAERFPPDPFSLVPGARLYRTGDLAARMQDEEIDFLGRADLQTKVRGHRVEPDQVAAAIRNHPAVVQAAVIPAPLSAGESALLGFVVWRESCAGDIEELRMFLESNLPPYMVPMSLTACPVLPMNRNGKLDRAALMAMAARRAPTAPTTLTETLVSAVFSEVLDGREIGVSDDFFECGGTVLQAVRLSGRLRAVFDTPDFPLGQVYAARTVEGIARAIDRDKRRQDLSRIGDEFPADEIWTLLADRMTPPA
jgi:hypothetical protein